MPLALFFVSGACALVYQVVWVRRLLLLTGTTTAAVCTVLAVFMTGLGVGAWVLGPRADRSRNPLRLYGLLELGIALYALILPRLLAAATPVYVEMARGLDGRPELLLPLRVAFGFLLLLAPTLLMGGTLPALVRFVGRDAERFGRDLGVLYGANLAGGVAGSLAAGFLLIRWLGVEGATMAAVLANLSVALAALLVAARWKARDGTAESVPLGALRLAMPPSARPLVWVAVVLSGMLTMAYEVLWTRILVFPFTSTVYAFTLILATFLGGLALGSRLFVAVERRPQPLRALAAAQILAGLSALFCTPVATRLADVMGGVSGWLGSSGAAFLAATAISACLVMLVPATFMGLVLPLGMRLLVDDLARASRQVGSAYLWNTAGSVAGSLLAGFVLVPLLALKGTLLLLASVQVALGWAFLAHVPIPARRRLEVLAASAVLLLAGIGGAAALLAGPSPFDQRLPGGSGPPVFEAHRDAIGASISVLRYPADGTKALRIDGFTAAAEGPAAGYMPMMTHIPMLLHPDPRRLLVICFGTGSTAGAGLLYPGTSIDVVDINRAVFEFAPHFEAWNHGVASHPRARLVVDDGRNFLLTSRDRYDVITSEPMPPRFAGVVNLYSREYYELARAHLSPGGFVVQWLPLHLVKIEEGLSILRTVADVFPETTLWFHDMTGIIVARRDGPIAIDLGRVARAMESAPLRHDLSRFGVRTPTEFVQLYALGPAAIRRAVSGMPAVTDDRPSLEFHAPRSPIPEARSLPQLGTAISRELSRGIEVVHRLRLEDDDPVPVLNVTAAGATEAQRRRKAESHALLARLYVLWDRQGAAVAEFEAAARFSDDPQARNSLLAEAVRAREGAR